MSSTTNKGGGGSRALFLAFEGGEGSGKTTQIALLSEWLADLGVAHRITREPGGTAVGEAIRSVVLTREELDMPPESELFLYLAARAAFVREVVTPALAAGDVVIADRFAMSTMAYQGYGRGLDLDDVRRAIAMATGGVEPDLTVLLDVPVDVGEARQGRESKALDRVERAGSDFRRRVREGYLALVDEDPRARVVSGVGTAREVQDRIRSVLSAEFPETFGGASG